MKTVDDLRATLSVHAPSEDTALLDRAAAVRSRVRVVRRRRRVGAVVGVVAAIALVAAAVTLPRLAGDRDDADLAAAATVTVGGFEYRLVKVYDTEPGQHALDLALPRSARDQAVVLLAEHLGGGSVTLRRRTGDDAGDPSDADDLDRIVADGAGPTVPLPDMEQDGRTTQPLALDVTGAGPDTRVGVALYRRTDAMPDGVVDPTGATVFRRTVGGRRLLAGAFIAPGTSEQTIRFTGALSEVRLADFCSVPGGGSPKRGPWLHVSIDGSGFTSGSCGPAREDATGGSYFPSDRRVEAHTARVWISATEGGGPTPVAGAVAGLGIYGPADTVQVHGSTIDRIVESDGRLWQLDRVIDSVPGGHEIDATFGSSPDHLLVGYATERTRRVSTGGSVPGGGTVDMSAGSVEDSVSSAIGGVVLPGRNASFTVRWPARYADASGAVLVYRPLD